MLSGNNNLMLILIYKILYISNHKNYCKKIDLINIRKKLTYQMLS